jgi:cytochrome c
MLKSRLMRSEGELSESLASAEAAHDRWRMRTGTAILLAGLGVLGSCQQAPKQTATGPVDRGRPGARINMTELHRTGGVPPTWRFTVPPGDPVAGRQTFFDLGCQSCHRVASEPSTAKDEQRGPDLTGMGSHHPAEYFAESILSPDAVLVDGPGWIGPDGRSLMPSYPDVTLRQLADLVAYLKALRAGGAADMMAAVPVKLPSDAPPPPASDSSIYYAQVYDVLPGELGNFEEWFRTEGAKAFLAYDGVTRVDTWVDVAHDGPALATIIGFRDEAALKRFLDDPATDPLGKKFDEFIGPHIHRVFRRPPVYRADSLSTP